MVDYSAADAAFATIEDLTLSPQQVADGVVKWAKQSIGPDPTRGNFTPDDEEDGEWLGALLWSLWDKMLELAQEDEAIHDRIAHILAALQAKGSEGCEGWRVDGRETNWSELPFFGIASREEMNGASSSCRPPTHVLAPQRLLAVPFVGPQPGVEGMGFIDITAPKAQALLAGDTPTDDEPYTREMVRCRKVWLNTNAFLARLWALAVWDGAFFGIATMRMHLEPLTLSSTSGPTATVGLWRNGTDHPEELQIEVAALWLRIAGAQMYTCREIMGPKGNPDWQANRGCPGGSGGTWDGVDGYHPDRWKHWKGILQEVAKGSWRRSVIDAAKVSGEATRSG